MNTIFVYNIFNPKLMRAIPGFVQSKERTWMSFSSQLLVKINFWFCFVLFILFYFILFYLF